MWSLELFVTRLYQQNCVVHCRIDFSTVVATKYGQNSKMYKNETEARLLVFKPALENPQDYGSWEWMLHWAVRNSLRHQLRMLSKERWVQRGSSWLPPSWETISYGPSNNLRLEKPLEIKCSRDFLERLSYHQSRIAIFTSCVKQIRRRRYDEDFYTYIITHKLQRLCTNSRICKHHARGSGNTEPRSDHFQR